jgi:predicted KAP-like P-loop ATPase
MFTDESIKDLKGDKFKRAAFSERIAKTIVCRKDKSSITIGIYGAWGEGKTTVLNFVKAELIQHKDIILAEFNPWHFNDSNALLKSFFETLSNSLGKSLSTHKEDIGKWLENYVGILAPINFTFGLLQVSPGAAAKDMGKQLSTVDVIELKNRLGKLLNDENKRLVVIIDDIDRMDRQEIQAMFKLIKVSADFSSTIYLLAFDENMVASALSEQYGAKDSRSGRDFLEKIIQVPLHLPKADKISLRKLCFEFIEKALQDSEIELPESQLQDFAFSFIKSLERKLHTPRLAKLYGNSLSFCLPLLRGEVNYVDLLLIEGLRIFYPSIYNCLRDNPEIVLGNNVEIPSTYQKNNYEISTMQSWLEDFSSDEKSEVQTLLKRIFPRTRRLFGEGRYSSDYEGVWYEKKCACSRHYFDRYFSYSVSDRDISDVEIDNLIQAIEEENVHGIELQIQKILNNENADSLVMKLRQKERSLSAQSSRKLALAIAHLGGIFPNPEIFFVITTAFSQAGFLVSQLIKNIPSGLERYTIAKDVISEAEPISFAFECLRWIKTAEKQAETEQCFSVDEENKLDTIMAQKISDYAKTQDLFEGDTSNVPGFFRVWAKSLSKQEASKYVESFVSSSSGNVLKVLRSYLGRAWAGNKPVQADLQFEQFQEISKIVDPAILFSALEQIYGEELSQPEYENFTGKDDDLHLANQFSFLYKKWQDEQNLPS